MYGLGIDVGSYETKGVVFDFEKNKIIDFTKIKTKGFQRGNIKNKKDFDETISNLIDTFESSLETTFKKAIVGFCSDSFSARFQKDFIFINHDKVKEEDIERIESYPKRGNIPSSRTIVDFYPISWYLDGVEIQDPIEKPGTKLELFSLIIDGYLPFIEDFKVIFNKFFNEDFKIKFPPYCSASLFLDDREKDIGTLFVDIGHETTSMILFYENKCLGIKVIPLGSYNLTKDLAVGLRVDIEVAEEIKNKYGMLGSKKISKKEKISNSFGEFSLKEITDILDSRFEEILEKIDEFLKDFSFSKKIPGGIVFSGGGSKISNIVNFTKEKMKIYAKKNTLVNKFFDSQDQDFEEYANAISMLKLEYKFFEEKGILSKIKRLLGFN
jgi:cell division protein FtsA